MSRTGLPPLALTGNPQVLNVPSQLGGMQLRVGNESAITLGWQWGDQGGILYPSEIDVWRPDATAGQQIQLTPIGGILPISLALTANLVSEVAFAPDSFPGTYPQQMSRLSQTAFNKLLAPVFTGSTPAINPTFTVNANATVTKLIAIQPGCTAIRVSANNSGLSFAYSLAVIGANSSVEYYGSTVPGAVTPVPLPNFPITVGVDFELDSVLSVTVQNTQLAGGGPMNVFVSQLLDVEAPGQVGDAQTVRMLSPAAWQSPNQTPLVNSVLTTAGVYKQILAPVGAFASLLLHWLRFDLDAASGGVFAVSIDGVSANVFANNNNSAGPFILGPLSGESYGTNAGLFVFTTAAVTVRYHVGYSLRVPA